MNSKQAKPGYWALVFAFAAVIFHATCQDESPDDHPDQDPHEGRDNHLDHEQMSDDPNHGSDDYPEKEQMNEDPHHDPDDYPKEEQMNEDPFYSREHMAQYPNQCGDPDESGPCELDYPREEQDPDESKLLAVLNNADASSDSQVSMHEFMEYAAKMRRKIAVNESAGVFHKMDTNKDGVLGMDEIMGQFINDTSNHNDSASEKKGLREGLAAMLEVERKKIKAADINNDGLLTADEYAVLFDPALHPEVLEIAAKYSMSQMDIDKDGQLAVHEFCHGEAAGKDEPTISNDDRNDFKKLDRNGDGLLSIRELKAWESGDFHINEALKKVFEEVDTDENMHLSWDEVMEAKKFILDESNVNKHFIQWMNHTKLTESSEL